MHTYDSNYVTFWRLYNRGTSKQSSACQRLGEREGWIGGALEIFCTKNLFCMTLWWWIHDHMNFSKPIELSTERVNTSVKCKLELIMICQCWLIYVSKCSTLLQDGNTRGNMVLEREERGYIGNLIIFCLIFLALKIALKIDSINTV